MLFAVCAPGLPPVTAEEVRALGLQDARFRAASRSKEISPKRCA